MALGLPSCGMLGGSDGPGEVGEPDVRAEVEHAERGPAEGTGRAAVPFTARMLGGIDRSEVNTVCSPLSAQIVLTMAGMGAAGDTRAQMEHVLGGSMDELAEAANSLSSVLAVVGDEEREADEEDAPEPAVASLVIGVWAKEGMELEQAYLEDLTTALTAGVSPWPWCSPWTTSALCSIPGPRRQTASERTPVSEQCWRACRDRTWST